MKLLILLFLMMGAKNLAHALDVGDEVLFKTETQILKGRLEEIANNKGRIHFHYLENQKNWGQNYYELGKTIWPFKAVDSLEIESRDQKFKLKEGEQVILFNSTSARLGKAEELSADGYVRLSFPVGADGVDRNTEQFYSIKNLALYESASEVRFKGRLFAVGQDVIFLRIASAVKGTIESLTTSGFGCVAFSEGPDGSRCSNLYDFRDESFVERLIPVQRVDHITFRHKVEEQDRILKVGETVRFKYHQWIEKKGMPARQYVGDYRAKIVELTSAGYARLRVENDEIEQKTKNKYFLAWSDFEPLKLTEEHSVVDATVASSFARVFGRRPELLILDTFKTGDEVLVTMDARVKRAQVEAVTSDGRIQFLFQDPVMQLKYGGQIFEIGRMELEKIVTESRRCDRLL